MDPTDNRTGRAHARDAIPDVVRGFVMACCLLALVAACAPALQPVRTVVAEGAPIPVAAGDAVRVLVAVGYGDVGLRPGDLDRVPLSELVPRPRKDVTAFFVLRGIQAADDWTVRLDGVDRVIEPLGDPEGASGRSYALEVAIRVGVPEGTDGGTYRVGAELYAVGAGGHAIDLIVRVR